VVAELAIRAAERGIAITVQADEVIADVDATQIAVALRALVDNSVEAIGQHGEIVVTVRRAGESVEIIVRDTGPGISPVAGEHMFDPFYSGREAGRGLGFGLSKCWRIATDHGGEVLVGKGPGGCFTLRLPC
jgi:signal transduction histidine kinase